MFKINKVMLNVINLQQQINFYQHVIGLEVISQTAEKAILGVQTHPLLELIAVTQPHQPQQAGLYHTAFLLPSRKALANKLQAMINQQYPLDGAADHGYSEAIYLHDPEGNGIEIYADKPQSSWTILENQTIVGVTEPLDVHGLLALANQPTQQLPLGSIIGHIHLSVVDLKQSYEFFHHILNLDLKYNLQNSAYFMAAENYHHHFGLNIWNPMITLPNNNQGAGLRGYQVEVDKKTYQQIRDRLEDYTEENQMLSFFDNSHHQVWVKTSF